MALAFIIIDTDSLSISMGLAHILKQIYFIAAFAIKGCRADTLVRFAAGSPENGLFMPKWSVFGLFLPPKVLFHTWNMHV